MLVLALFIVGLGCVFAEVFIPSAGLLGVLGVGSTVASLAIAYIRYPDHFAIIAIVETLVFIGMVVPAILFAIKRFSLHSSQKPEEGYTSAISGLDKYIGLEGVAVTPLRPAGTVKIGDKRLDAVTHGTFCPAGGNVVVKDIESNSVVVELVEEQVQ